ncbi:MAG: gamma-glutamyl-gamma-aminobutyrate hydrolase family protein [Melioribacteraceae bacterium]|nr:gamma-glutamyl-gamma-aminobutyrate hydrolase family protein [Melioribacteraceae bacterium]
MKNAEMKLLIADNYDSFTFNLVELIRRTGFTEYDVVKSDRINLEEVQKFDKILFTPGPGLPKDFPIMFDILEKYEDTKSILGICLGHQALGEFYGAKLINLNSVVHGISKSVQIIDSSEPLFHNIPAKIDVGLYHSWFISSDDFPEELKVTAISGDNIIMALSHKKHNVRGVQFHPESIMTTYGEAIIRNWLNL